VSKLLPFSPRTGNRVLRMRAIPDSWSGSQLYSPETAFLRNWLEPEERPVPTGVNWGAISGLALSAAISAGCWTGLAILIGRIWK
jgi:hypothetical protein